MYAVASDFYIVQVQPAQPLKETASFLKYKSPVVQLCSRLHEGDNHIKNIWFDVYTPMNGQLVENLFSILWRVQTNNFQYKIYLYLTIFATAEISCG